MRDPQRFTLTEISSGVPNIVPAVDRRWRNAVPRGYLLVWCAGERCFTMLGRHLLLPVVRGHLQYAVPMTRVLIRAITSRATTTCFWATWIVKGLHNLTCGCFSAALWADTFPRVQEGRRRDRWPFLLFSGTLFQNPIGTGRMFIRAVAKFLHGGFCGCEPRTLDAARIDMRYPISFSGATSWEPCRTILASRAI